MQIQSSYLRQHRKRSPLTQNDIAFIMNLSDIANVCRWEKGARHPTMDVAVMYHLLFGFPLATLFDGVTQPLATSTIERIKLLVERLKDGVMTPKVKGRIAFLESTLTRLTQQPL